MNDLKEWMFDKVYLEPERVRTESDQARRIVKRLFDYYQTPGNLPAGFEGVQGAVDYIAGMTDRFAISAAEAIP